MPSPTSSTRPTCLVSSFFSYCWISLCRTETISSALNLMTASFDQLIAKVVQSSANGGIVNRVADAHLEPAQQGGIDVQHQHRLELKIRMKLGPESNLHVLAQRHR